MQSHEVIQKSINGKSLAHAKRLGVSLSLVSKWQEPSLDFSDSGAYNPLDRIKTIMDGSKADGNGPERFLAPLHWLAREYRHIAIPLPSPNENLPELHRGLLKMTKEFGDLLSVSGEKFADGDVSRRDALAIRQEAYEMQTVIAAFLAKVEETVSKNKD